MTKHATVELSDEAYSRLERHAEKHGRTAMSYMVEAVEELLEDIEDIEMAERALERLKSGESHTIPLEEVQRRLGLDD